MIGETMMGEASELPISPLAGEMSGRTEGGVKECDVSELPFAMVCCGPVRVPNADMLAGQHPPLACRPSPPQGGRSATRRCRRLLLTEPTP